MNHWLFKTEPEVFSFDDLWRAPQRTSGWDGVRNYQARNLIRDEMKSGDRVLIYHSRVEPMSIVGEAEIVRAGYPDPTQFEKRHNHYDPDSLPDEPRWFQVDVKALAKLARPVTLGELKAAPALRQMALLRRGNRLSVQPVTAAEYAAVLALASTPGPGAPEAEPERTAAANPTRPAAKPARATAEKPERAAAKPARKGAAKSGPRK